VRHQKDEEVSSSFTGTIFDKKGRNIAIGDIVKVYHFTDQSGRRHYMYKQAAKIDFISSGHAHPYLWFSHLNLDQSMDGFYFEPLCGTILKDAEIVQSASDDFEDRPSILKPKS